MNSDKLRVLVYIMISDLVIENQFFGNVIIRLEDRMTEEEVKKLKTAWKSPGFLKSYITGYDRSGVATMNIYLLKKGYVPAPL